MRKLVVNWSELDKTGKDFEDYVLDFEKNRLLLEKEVQNVSNYWTGDDAVVYQTKAIDNLEVLKKDVDYLYEWARYFKNSSKIYNGVEEDGLQKIRNSIDLLGPDNDLANNGGAY